MPLVIALLVLTFDLVCTAAYAQIYHVVDVPPPPGGTIGEFQISDRLIGVGLASDGTGAERRAFVFDGVTSNWLPLDRPVAISINNLAIVAGVRSTGVAFFFNALDGSGYTETALQGCSQTIRRFTDSGILLLSTADTSSRACAVYRSTVYDLSAFGIVSDVDEDGTLAINGSAGSFLQSLAGDIRRPFPPGVGIVHVRGGYVVGGAGGVTSPELVYARPNGVVSRAPLGNFPSRAHGINRSGLVVGTAISGVRTLAFAPFLYRDGAFQAYQLDDPAVAPMEGLQVTDSGVVLVNGRRGDGPIYSISGFFLLLPTTSVPSAPTGVSFILAGRTVTLGWQPSAGALDYIVEAGSTPGASDFFNAAVGSQPSISGGVPPGRYYVRIRARSASGISGPSAEVTITVP